MNSNKKKKIKPYNPFNGAVFDDGKVWELDHLLVTGQISLEEYKKRILQL